MAIFTTDDNNFGTSKWIVNSTAGLGTHTTIASALTSASSGDTIFVMPGTYTENISLKAGVNITATGADGLTTNLGSGTTASNVIILGSVTANYTGSVTLNGLQLKTNSAAALIVSGSGASQIFLNDCTVFANNATGMTFNNSACFATFTTCYFLSTSTNLLFAITACPIDFEFCIFSLSATASASTIAVNNVLFNACDISGLSITTSTTGSVFSIGCHWQYGGNTLLTTVGTGTSTIVNSWLSSTTASTISIGTGTTVEVYNSEIYSSNTNAITGAGTLKYAGVVFGSTSSTINTTTQTGGLLQGGKAQAPSAGFIGEQITASASSVATTTATAKTITSISLTPGIWDISGSSISISTGGTAVLQAVLMGISATDNTITGTVGIDYLQVNIINSNWPMIAPLTRVTLTTTTTYYLVVQNFYTATTCPTSAKITATRVG